MLKDKLRLIRRTLKVVHELNRAVLTLQTIEAIVDAAQLMVPLVVAARIVSGLEKGLPARDLIIFALLGSALALALVCISQVVGKYSTLLSDNIYTQFAFTRSRKTLRMDFQELDSESTRHINDRINTDQNWGAGITSVVWAFGSIVSAVVQAAIAAALAAPMLTALPGTGTVVLFLVGVSALTLGSILYANNQSRKGWAALHQSSAKRRLLWYFLDGNMRLAHGKDIRIYGAQPVIASNGIDEMRDNGVGGGNASGFAGRSSGVSAAVSGAIQGGAYLYVGLQALSGVLDLGAVFLYAGAIHQFSAGLSQLMQAGSEFMVSCERMQSSYDFLDIPDTLYKGTIPIERRRDNDYTIEFHDVSFRYPGSENWALRNLNMKLRIGERMAVVGRNGSGKTTMIKLLCRLYDPTEGVITLNGVDIRKYDYRSYLKLFSVVFQDFQLYAFPLDQNVAASVQPDGGRATEALEKAGFGERLKTMGLKTHLYKEFDDGGVEVSGGEAQKIALARALYKGAPFVILDEPTAALDPIAEFDIYSRFNDIVGERTAVYISHRLSSCRFCQDIAVFHEGRLVQRGSHDMLMTDPSGMYHALWTAQAQYYQQERSAS